MFYTSEYIIASEIDYRHERIAADWQAARRTNRLVRSRPPWMRRRPAPLLGARRARGATLA
jgi:hypothetical protein